MRQKLTFSALAATVAFSFSSCSTNLSSNKFSLGNWEKEARLVEGSTKTPQHSLPKTEYPFDEKGNYISSWAASGEGRFGKAHRTWAAVVSPELDGMVAVAKKAVEDEDQAVADEE